MEVAVKIERGVSGHGLCALIIMSKCNQRRKKMSNQTNQNWQGDCDERKQWNV